MSVSWFYQETSIPRENNSLFYTTDLRRTLPEWVTVGFSAATGTYQSRRRLTSWEFNSSLERKETNEMDATRTRIIIGVTICGFVVVAGIIIEPVILQRRKQIRRNQVEAMNLTSINDDLERGAGPRKFSHSDLALATNRF